MHACSGSRSGAGGTVSRGLRKRGSKTMAAVCSLAVRAVGSTVATRIIGGPSDASGSSSRGPGKAAVATRASGGHTLGCRRVQVVSAGISSRGWGQLGTHRRLQGQELVVCTAVAAAGGGPAQLESASAKSCRTSGGPRWFAGYWF